MQDNPSPQELAARFDHFSSEQVEQPYDLYRRLRDGCPVGHSEALGGFWFAMRYDDVAAIVRNFRTFSNADGVALPRQPTSPMFPVELDPPQHTDLKAALIPLMHVSKAEALSTDVEAEVDRILSPAIPSGEFDLATLADHIPATFALRVIGIDKRDQPQLLEWTDTLSHGRGDPASVIEAGAAFDRFVLELVARRRNEPRRDDLISALFDADVPGMGGKLDDDQIRRTVVLLIFGGLHTTRSAILESLHYIARHPDVRSTILARLEDETFWGPAVDEFLRYSTPTQILKRKVTAPTELQGQKLEAGDDLMICYGSANHDERKFADPEKVILDRSPNPHLTFGAGPHRCIGQYFARVFLRSAIRGVMRRMPDFAVADDFTPHYQVGEARAMISLPVTFTPSPS
ncbi:MAG: cytochrome P450 [Caulobacteraceae bacterium]|jgi:cytochrome P450